MRKTKYTKEQLAPIVKSCSSLAGVLRKLGLKPAGGNYSNIQRVLDSLEIDTNHFTGQLWSKGKEIVPFEDLTSRTAIKSRLIAKLGHRCQSCKNEKWLGQPIMIELEHVDGNNRNNEEANLRLLCPNCHSQTSTWRNRKRVKP